MFVQHISFLEWDNLLGVTKNMANAELEITQFPNYPDDRSADSKNVC